MFFRCGPEMSYGQEWLNEHAFERDFPFGFPRDTWTTADGRKIPLTEMTTQHILNCMKCVGEGDDWHERFEIELDRRRKS